MVRTQADCRGCAGSWPWIAFGRRRSSLSYGQFGVYVRSTGPEFSGEWRGQQWRIVRGDWPDAAKSVAFMEFLTKYERSANG